MVRILPKDLTATNAGKIGMVIDHLVDALGGDPSCSLRRALILTDIAENPETTQADIMKRLEIDKSSAHRDIEWLYDHGCIMRHQNRNDARVLNLKVVGYSLRNLNIALEYFQNSHKSLKSFLEGFIKLFGNHKPTLRDAKIIAALGDKGTASKQELLEELYSGPVTTDTRSIHNLIMAGHISRDD